jgi:aryl-alcohol dehydrogenase-like predicted oxidoreductase
MEKRRFGNTDMEVSMLGFGGSEIGYQNASVNTVEKLLGSALESGLNVIDTAECYMNSEELIGKAVSHRRNEFYLFTKCGHSKGDDNIVDSGDTESWSITSITRSIDRSLKRL